MEDLRRIFLVGLDRQIALAHDPDYSYPSHEYSEENGQTVKQIVYKRPMPWWFEENGTLLLRLSFGERTMIIPGKNPVIRVGKRSNLLPTLEALHILVDDRQMDDVIEKMVRSEEHTSELQSLMRISYAVFCLKKKKKKTK